MLKSAINELAAASDGLTLAATLGTGTVQVWNLSTLALSVEINTLYRYIGSRSIVVSPAADFLIVADSLGGRMAAYSIPRGEELWRRRLPNPDRFTLGALADRFWYSRSLGGKKPAVESAESRTGNVLQVVDGGKSCFEGHDRALLAEMWKESAPLILLRGSQKIEIPRMSFGLLFALFASDCLLLSEAAGPVRCLNDVSGEMHWIFLPEPGSHIRKLYYNRADNFAYGIWDQYENKKFRRLVKFELSTGKMDVVCDLSGWSECFVPVREQIVTSDGSIFDIATGRSMGSLDFPKRIQQS